MVRVIGYCHGYVHGLGTKAHKFILKQNTHKKPIVMPESDAEAAALADESQEHSAPIHLLKKAEYVAIGTWQLPTYSPWVQYEISLCVAPTRSVWSVDRVWCANKRFPSGVPKKVLIEYALKVCRWKSLHRDQQAKLKSKISVERDLDVNFVDVGADNVTYLKNLLAAHFRNADFYWLLPAFNAQFLARYTESQWLQMRLLIEENKGYIFCFKSLYLRHFHPWSENTDVFLRDTTAWISNMIQWVNQYMPIKYHHHYALWDIKRLCQFTKMEEAQLEVIKRAFALYRDFEQQVDFRGNSYLHYTRGPCEELDFLIEHQIVNVLEYHNDDYLLSDVFDARYEIGTATALGAIGRVHMIQLDTYHNVLPQTVSQLIESITSESGRAVPLVMGEGRITAGLLHLMSGQTVYTVESDREYSNNYVKMTTGAQKRSREERTVARGVWPKCTHLIIVKASRLTVKSFYEALRKIRADLPNPMLSDVPVDNAEDYHGLAGLTVYMLGDIGEHVLTRGEGYGASSVLFHAMASPLFPRANFDLSRLTESREECTIRRMHRIISHANQKASSEPIPVSNVKTMGDHIKDWAKKYSKIKKPMTQIFCSSNSAKRAILSAAKAPTEVLYDTRTFSINDFVIVTDLGILGFIKAAKRKETLLSGETSWAKVDIKEPIKTHMEEYLLEIENSPQSISSTATTSSARSNANDINGGRRINIIETSQHPKTLKHAYALLPQEFMGYQVDYIFFYVDASTTATDIVTAEKYAKREIIFFLAPEVDSLNMLRSSVRKVPNSLLFHYV